ncbi:MAG: endonuclease III domain-containing protein [Deltaproteobacteria bacterium]|nr:endonuclease III domain-containing protein [Deltaproteobacteria bacterium]
MTRKAKQILEEIFERLLEYYGPQHWWPAETALEMMVGAVLTQNTAWKNVEKALANLRQEGLLAFEALQSLELEALADKIRPSGYYNLKARRLKALLDFLGQESPLGKIELFKSKETSSLRKAFLGVWGLGPETVDSILLYALDRPVFVIDQYTYRVFLRHHLIAEESSYEEMQSLAMDHLPEDLKKYQEYHALLVRVGKEYCGPKARCESCPLKGINW